MIPDISPLFQEPENGTSDEQQARAMVHTHPDFLAGTEPVIRGTRVPVYTVAAEVQAGLTAVEILACYPSLTEKQVHLAALFAQLEPPV